jgi:hypothetical protein
MSPATYQRALRSFLKWILFVGCATAIVGQSFDVFDAPSASFTYAASVNASGAIAGYFAGSAETNYRIHAFIRDRDGSVTVFDAPSAWNTYACGINSNGDVAGYFEDPLRLTAHGFVRNKKGDFDVFDPRVPRP